MEIALPKALDAHPGFTGAGEETLGACRCLVGPLSRCGEDHPVDLEIRTGVQQLQHGSAATDFDVVAVRPNRAPAVPGR